MKELSIEEKAKAYDKAIKVAESIHRFSSDPAEIKRMEQIFPELEESEDEKIRERIIALVNAHGQGRYKGEMLAWLEKQGEQDMIPLNKVIKFLDDQLVNDKDEVTGQSFINFRNYGAFKETFISYFKRKMLEKQDEQKPQGKSALEAPKEENVDNQNCVKPANKIEPKSAEWSDDFEEEMDRYIEENFYGSADNGFFSNRTKRELEAEDVVRIGCHFAAWQKEQSDKELSDKLKQEWSEEDESWFKELELMALSFSSDDSYRKKFFDWLKSLKDRVQPKQEWSEEDEKVLHAIRNALNYEKPRNYLKSRDFEFTDILDWLKSLRHQNTWKPSDLPHWKKSSLPNDGTTGFNSDYFCHKGYCINYKELFEKLPKDD